METNNTRLLWSKDKLTINDGVFDFESIWKDLLDAYKKITGQKGNGKYFGIIKQIEYLETKHKAENLACYCLQYGKDDKLIELIESNGYSFSNDFENSLIDITKKSEMLLVKAKRLRTKLPKESESQKVSIEDVISSYSSVLSFELDYNMSVTEFLAIKRQVENKIKSLEKNA